MKKFFILFFVFFISCSPTESETLIPEEPEAQESVVEEEVAEEPEAQESVVEEEVAEEPEVDVGFDDYSEIVVPQSTPETLQVIRHELSEKVDLYFTTEVETEIHVHGYDIHFMVYPDQENILTIALSIAGEFEIEDHDSEVEFARLIVSP